MSRSNQENEKQLLQLVDRDLTRLLSWVICQGLNDAGIKKIEETIIADQSHIWRGGYNVTQAEGWMDPPQTRTSFVNSPNLIQTYQRDNRGEHVIYKAELPKIEVVSFEKFSFTNSSWKIGDTKIVLRKEGGDCFYEIAATRDPKLSTSIVGQRLPIHNGKPYFGWINKNTGQRQIVVFPQVSGLHSDTSISHRGSHV